MRLLEETLEEEMAASFMMRLSGGGRVLSVDEVAVKKTGLEDFSLSLMRPLMCELAVF